MPARRRRRTITDYMRTKTNDYVTCAAIEPVRKIGNQWRLTPIDLVEMLSTTEEALAKHD